MNFKERIAKSLNYYDEKKYQECFEQLQNAMGELVIDYTWDMYLKGKEGIKL